jgi:hypothetical protein
VILDDVFNADWPEVYLGLALYLEGHLYEALQASFVLVASALSLSAGCIRALSGVRIWCT